MPRKYLCNGSLRAHESMNETFMRAMITHWGEQDIHLSCDTAIARGVPESRLEIPSMITWDAFIGNREMQELRLGPRFRHYHRYLPFQRSAQQALDEYSREKLKISLHHQLLTGVVIYIDPGEFTSIELDAMESSVVRNKVLLLAPGHYWRQKFEVTTVTRAEGISEIEGHFEKLSEAINNSRVFRLYYKYPDTFLSQHYVPEGIRNFLSYLQNHRCPCKDACDLKTENAWAVDHILPKYDGGTSVLINLQATCKNYNSGRKRERPEPRTVSYCNIMSDRYWTPVISAKYREDLLNRTYNSGLLENIEAQNKRITDRAIAQMKRVRN